ncbi:MAG: Ig-like domain-containing protein [Gemmatimonadaceae bacterium]
MRCSRFANLAVATFFTIVAVGCSASSDPTSDPKPTVPTVPTPVATVATVTVSPSNATIVAPQSTTLSATAKDAAGNTLSSAITWTSSSSPVATVNSSGVVTGVSAGTATITASSGGVSGTALITVNVVESMLIGPAGGTFTTSNGAASLTFPEGALTTPTQISVTPVQNPVTSGLLYHGPAFELGPTGTQFAKPVSLKIKYDASLPSGTDAAHILMYTLNGGKWEYVHPSFADTISHTTNASISHFSYYNGCMFPCYDLTAVAKSHILASYIMDAGTVMHLRGSLYEHLYTGPAFVTVEGLPSGVTAAASGDLTHDNATLFLDFTASASMPGGLYQIVIRTKAPGLADDVVNETLQVIGQSFTFTASPIAVTVAQGGSATTTLNVNRVGSFSGALALTAENLPAGVTATFSQAPITGTSSTLTLRATPNATLGAAAPIIRAKTATYPDAIIALSLFITPTNVAGFSVVGSPAFIHTQSTATATTGIRASRTGVFSGAIAYTVSGLPAGMTASVSPTGVTDSVSLSVTTAALAVGEYPITVSATSGSITHDVVVTVSVAPQGQLAMHLDYSTCAGARPVWIAFQDGTAAFTRVSGVGDSYDFTLTAQKGAVAVVTPNGGGYTTTVSYGTQAEFSNFAATISCPFVPAGKTIYASVANASGDVQIGVGSGFGIFDHFLVTGSVPVTNVANGPQDASAFMQTLAAPKMILRRDQDIANGSSLALFDFASAEAFTPASAHVSVSNANAIHMAYFTRGTGCPLSTIYNATSLFSPPNTIYGVPSSLQRAGDMHAMYAVSGSASSYTAVINIFHTMSDQSAIFGAPLSANAVSSAAGTPYQQLRATTNLSNDYQSLTLNYGDGGNSFAVVMSAAFAGSSSVTMTAPNFANTGGYQTTWAPTGSVHYTLSASSHNFVTKIPSLACADGATVKSATVTGNN